VLDGLTPDAQVVISGAGFLNDGDLVRNVPAAPAVPATPAARPAAAKNSRAVAAR
jgi:hypothetical protein